MGPGSPRRGARDDDEGWAEACRQGAWRPLTLLVVIESALAPPSPCRHPGPTRPRRNGSGTHGATAARRWRPRRGGGWVPGHRCAASGMTTRGARACRQGAWRPSLPCRHPGAGRRRRHGSGTHPPPRGPCPQLGGGAVTGFAELAAASNFSFLRGASHPWELVATAARLGLAAIGIADRNTLAGVVRAHAAARKQGVRLVVGTRLVLEDGFETLCFPTDRPAYGRLTRLLTLGNRRAPKGRCLLALDDVLAFGDGQLFVVMPPYDGADAVAAGLARLAAGFPGSVYLAATAAAARRRPSPPGPAAGAVADPPDAARRHHRRAVPHAGAPAAAGRADLHPRALHHRHGGVPAGDQRRAAPEAGSRDAAAVRRPRGRRRAHPGTGRSLPVLARRVVLRVPGRAERGEPHPAAGAGAADLGGCRRAPARAECRAARHDRARAAADRVQGLRAVLPDGARHRAVRTLARSADPVPGPRLRRQLGGLLLPRRHRRRPDRDRPAVRALHLRGPRRAARHRRGFRARAPRGGHPVRLRQVRPAPGRAGRHRDLLPHPQRRPRGRQGHGAVARRGRGAGRDGVGVFLGRRRPGAGRRGRSRPDRPPAGPGHAADRRADRLSPPPLPARRRIRRHPRPAGGAGPDRQRGNAGPHHGGVGQGRSRRARDPEDRCAGARDADLPAQGLRAAARPLPPGRHPGHRAARGPAGLRDDPEGRHRRRLPDREPGADVDAAAAAAGLLLRPGDRGRDRAAGPDPGRHGASLPAAPAGPGAGPGSCPRNWTRCCARRWACRCSRNRP